MLNSTKINQVMSDDIKELVTALCKAQGVMKPAVFNKVNPHFKNKYADFTSCMECCREPLANNGLSVMQYCENINEKLMLVTMLAHVSGQWIKSFFPLNPLKMDSQSIGSAMSYGKRYSLSALLGIVSEDDDDGEAAHGRNMQNGNQYPEKQEKQQVYNVNLNGASINKTKISNSQYAVLTELSKKLDENCKSRIHLWLSSQYKINNLADVSTDLYEKVLVTIENAIKFMEQNKLELVKT